MKKNKFFLLCSFLSIASLHANESEKKDIKESITISMPVQSEKQGLTFNQKGMIGSGIGVVLGAAVAGFAHRCGDKKKGCNAAITMPSIAFSLASAFSSIYFGREELHDRSKKTAEELQDRFIAKMKEVSKEGKDELRAMIKEEIEKVLKK
jgi:hypothetical protein